MSLVELFGETLHGAGGAEVATSTLAGSGRYVGLYFSAHWCPPCRSFTPKLAEFYKAFAKKNESKLEIVFVSSDRDQGEFDGYFKDMTWLSLPFSDRDRKEKLGEMFSVKGIPTFIILDSETGAIVCSEARDEVMDDPEGEDFPWKKIMALIELLGEKLQGAGGAEVETSSLCGSGRYVGLYFSAHWCPPCRKFTPKLAEFYEAFTKKNEGKLEIVFVSADGKLEEFDDYFKEMPWLSLPYADRDREGKLSTKFEVQGIPTFIILDSETGDVICSEARDEVMGDPEGANFPWKK
ncbi:nucleoredoxin [Strongylocentrotus purpuratus]|uniref:Thioredoxin domain-containing protein n=1 Tax=Strongylocentrotus purpuratus TaxID=7668 RepID=A0A7M7P8V5_STRPU|nr:nucleoredoxin [Strongylocentrotus purpuratus]